jgi:hypothetical protein
MWILPWIHEGIRICSNSALLMVCPDSTGASLLDEDMTRVEKTWPAEASKFHLRTLFEALLAPKTAGRMSI